jgi:hypothetical protein
MLRIRDTLIPVGHIKSISLIYELETDGEVMARLVHSGRGRYISR